MENSGAIGSMNHLPGVGVLVVWVVLRMGW